MKRRTLLKSALLLPVVGIGHSAVAQTTTETASKPMTYSACCDCGMMDNPNKRPVDDAPLVRDIEKNPRCVVCNMDRAKFHYSRHLLHYADGFVQGTCSPRCASECLLQERRRGFIGVYAADMGSSDEVKPLINAHTAVYLVGSQLPGTMTRISKLAFSNEKSALIAKQTNGGELASFADVVSASLDELARAVIQRQLSPEQKTPKSS